MVAHVFRLLFAALGAALIGLFCYCLGSRLLFLRTAQPATATVVRLEAHDDDSDGGTCYFPVARFTTAAGQPVTATSPAGTGTPAYTVGEQVHIRYDPARPQRVELPDFFSQWGAILISAFFALCGWGLLRAVWGLYQRPPAKRPKAFAELRRRAGALYRPAAAKRQR